MVIKIGAVLRYRDFDLSEGQTIKLHNDIITASGQGVWWGWWKKDGEAYSKEQLGKLVAACDDEGSIAVGLLDRSSGSYHVGSCSKIIASEESFTSPSKKLTPEYYSDKKLRAWLYFEKISELNEASFLDKFGRIPASPERTFFPILDGIMDDSDGFFIHHANKLINHNILHISDIHLGADYGAFGSSAPGKKTIFDRLRHDSETLGLNPSLILFSGDITTRANTEVMREDGLDFLKKICDIFRIERNQLLFVPGNHDLPLQDYIPENYSHENEFRELIKDFYGSPKGITALHKFEHGDGTKTEVLTMNSVRLRNKELKNFGYVEWGLYDSQLKKMQIEPDSTRIAMLHHHLIPVPYEDQLEENFNYASVSTTIDAGSVIEGLHNHNFSIAVHGHQHIPGVSRISRGRSNDRELLLDKDLTIVSAGSLTSSRLADYMRNNSYNYISKIEKKMNVIAYDYTSAPGETKKYFTCRC